MLIFCIKYTYDFTYISNSATSNKHTKKCSWYSPSRIFEGEVIRGPICSSLPPCHFWMKRHFPQVHNSDRIGWENEARKSRGKDLEIPTEGDEIEEMRPTQLYVYTITIFLNRLPISYKCDLIYWKKTWWRNLFTYFYWSITFFFYVLMVS